MLNLYHKVRTWLQRQDGQGMVEYAMIVGLVAVGVLALLALLGGQIGNIFKSITDALKSFTPAPPPAG